ncbi:MAG TPA: hypothetical protein VGO47_10985, partial [Chlamydiales bacterium]|nr:hypothetical protein [Chlamydiales bacterium]
HVCMSLLKPKHFKRRSIPPHEVFSTPPAPSAEHIGLRRIERQGIATTILRTFMSLFLLTISPSSSARVCRNAPKIKPTYLNP